MKSPFLTPIKNFLGIFSAFFLQIFNILLEVSSFIFMGSNVYTELLGNHIIPKESIVGLHSVQISKVSSQILRQTRSIGSFSTYLQTRAPPMTAYLCLGFQGIMEFHAQALEL